MYNRNCKTLGGIFFENKELWMVYCINHRCGLFDEHVYVIL
nr:MAG TPA: hypothetical protein [Caudoviricetes sp.]